MNTWLVAYKEDYPNAMWRVVAESKEDAISDLSKVTGIDKSLLIAW